MAANISGCRMAAFCLAKSAFCIPCRYKVQPPKSFRSDFCVLKLNLSERLSFLHSVLPVVPHLQSFTQTTPKMKNKASMLSKYSVGNEYFALWQLSGQLRVFETGNCVLDGSASDWLIVVDTGKCFLNLKSVANTTRTDCLLKDKKTAVCWSTHKSKARQISNSIF